MDSKAFGDLIEKKLGALRKDIENLLVQFKATIRSEIKNAVSSSLKPFEKRLTEIEKAQQFQSHQYESFRKQVETVLRVNSELKAENEQLIQRIKDLERIDEVRATSVDNVEQYGRRDVVEVCGIPRCADENCENIILELAKKVNVSLSENEIEACHRISSKSEAAMITKLSSRKKREELMSKIVKSS